MNIDMTGFEQSVRERAYFMWENEGRPMGRHVEHWLACEDAMRAESEDAEAAPAEQAAVAAAPKPARAKKAAAPKAKAAAPKAAAAKAKTPAKKKPALVAPRGAMTAEMSASLQ